MAFGTKAGQAAGCSFFVFGFFFLIINQDSHCQVLFLSEKGRKPMVPS